MNLLKRTGQGLYGEVTRAWEGGTAVCIATGPSLTADQVETVRAARERGLVAGVIAINDAYTLAPWADVLYYADGVPHKWLGWHRQRTEFRAFAGQHCMIDTDQRFLLPDDRPFLLRHLGPDGLSDDPTGIRAGSNSGHQAINVAALSRPRRILLLGYDGRKSAQGRDHFFGSHPNGTTPPFGRMLSAMSTIPSAAKAMGIEIINCTPDSAIRCFTNAALSDCMGYP